MSKTNAENRNKETRELENSLICAMYDCGYNIVEIANKLDIPAKTVIVELGMDILE